MDNVRMTQLDNDLVWAAKDNDLDKVKELVENGADIFALIQYESKWFAGFKSVGITKFLIDKRALIPSEKEAN